MKQSDDYSGDFNPELSLNDFSHEALKKMVMTYVRLYKAMDAFWYMSVMDRSGNDEAVACDIHAWEKLAAYEMDKVIKAFNITGQDVESFFKAFQLTPWLWILKYDIEMVSNNHGIFKVKHCPTVDAIEREGSGRETDICNKVEIRCFTAYANSFNPAIKVRPLKTPPHKSKEGYYCMWEFKIVE